MPGPLRALIPGPLPALLAALLLCLPAAGQGPAAPAVPSDTAKPASAPALNFAESLRRADSLRSDSLRADSLRRAQAAAPGPVIPSDSARDLVPAKPRVYRWTSPVADPSVCPEALESAAHCWRAHPELANVDIGYPGTRAFTLSLSRLEPVPFASPFFPALVRSPYGTGGLLPPEEYEVETRGGQATALEEVWRPVAPLDTPVTSLEWERGALALNLFNLRLRRMLSAEVYLGLDYYSATADSQDYDYQFNVHQPYLGGWGFLGQIYGPIDRDSASLVLEGNSHAIDALNFRPRVGFWLDTNQVLEIFLDRMKNATTLTWPRGPGASDSLDEADSTQSLMDSRFAAWTGGAAWGYAGDGWTAQWDAGASTVEKATPRLDSTSLTGGGDSREDAWDGAVFRWRGRLAAPGLPLRPWVDAEAVSESWQGRLFLYGAGRAVTEEGWTDRASATAGLRPDWGWLAVEAEAGLARSSRMDNRVFWLPRAAGEAALRLPLRLEARAGASYEERDADWETLYRHNPGLFRHPGPGLDPRSDLGYRGMVAWTLPFIELEAGAEATRGEDVWLPYLLPSPEACRDLSDSLYAYPGAPACAGAKAPDSLALRLRNWDSETRAAWHLALGLELGNWRLDVRNRFLLLDEVEDAAFDGVLENRMVPARVFKGHLGWDRILLDGRLRVKVGWGWEWFSTRYAWVPDLQGQSNLRKLDEYLALDFQASMKIRAFLLYFKGMNFNHDRYATEPGVHPPGVNFRFGIDWTLRN